MDAIDDVLSNIVLRRIIEKLERNDIAGAIDALHIEPEAFSPLAEALRKAFDGGGIAEVGNMPILRDPEGHKTVVRWNMRNVPAEGWLSQHSAFLVTNTVDDAKEGIRQTLTASLSRGDNPTRAAIQIAGRKNRATGKREGGIIGLTSQQAQFADNARQQLISRDPDQLRAYLARNRRDKGPRGAWDKAVLQAIKTGKPIPADMIDRMAQSYSNRLLKLRADQLALNETMNALAASKHEAWRQQIDAGKVRAAFVEKVWKHLPGQEHPRMQHMAMAEKRVPFDQPFTMPDGTEIAYPHAQGTPIRHMIGCKCTVQYRTDFIGQLEMNYRASRFQ